MPTKPKIWVKKDIPTPGEMEIYLARIRATRELFPAVSGFPPLPESMSRLTFEGANNIEEALLRADELIEGIQKSRVYSGELQAGGV